MKICFDARPVINKQTGLGRYIINLIKSLLEIDKKNQYTIYVNSRLKRDHPLFHLKRDNLSLRSTKIKEVSVSQQLLVPFIVNNKEYDIYHYPNFDLPIGVSHKSVFTIHDLTYIKHKNLYSNGKFLKNFYTKWIIDLSIRKAKKIIAVSESTKKDILEIYNPPENKIKVIHEGLDYSFSVNGSGTKTTSILTNKSFNSKAHNFFLFIGERRPHKNLPRLIKAFSHFKNKIKSDYKLIIAGKPYAQYSEPEKVTKQLNLADDVIFLGYVEDKEIQALYKDSSCFIFPSIYEGFGLPLLEAMACGVPIITSNISSMPEVVGRAAITIDPYNIIEISSAMEKIHFDNSIRQNMIKLGFERIKEFSWQKSAEQTLLLYESIVIN